MARVAGADIPNDKRVEIALTYIYGIGLSSSKKILQATTIDPDTRVKDLTEHEITHCVRQSSSNILLRVICAVNWR